MAILTADHLTKKYPGEDAPALDDVSLSIEAGEFWRSSDQAGRANRRCCICSAGSIGRRVAACSFTTRISTN